MIKIIKEEFIKNKDIYTIGLILVISFISMLIYSLNDISVWWDEAIYIGMGKYIASGGNLGMWEIFRPPLLPLFYSFLFKLNIPLVLAGKVLVVIFSAGSMGLVYLISEYIKKGSGIFTSILLFITPVFFYYSKVPTTDIISMFFVLLALFLYSKNKYFITGVSISLAFLLRFPQGLILIPVGIMIIYQSYNINKIIWIKEVLNKGLLIGGGFCLLVVPYFISNYFLYGDFLKPLILGNQIVAWSSVSYNFGVFYYAKELLRIAPFLFLALLTPIFLYNKKFFDDLESRNNIKLIIVTVIIYMIYFFWQSHKELRYSLAFIPYLAILSGISFYFILNYFNSKKIILSLLFIGVLFMIYKSIPFLKDESSSVYIPIHNYIETLNGSYLSTTPVPSVFGKVRVLSLFESATGFHDAFAGSQNLLDGVIIKDCDIYCPEKSIDNLCIKDLNIIYDEINSSSLIKSYELKIDQCTYSIYKK